MIEEFAVMEDFLRPGVLFNANEPDGRIVEVRAVVDDEWVVFRVRNKRAWEYKVSHVQMFALLLASGYLRPCE